MMRLMRAVSLRICFRLHICFTQGFWLALALDASVYLTASVTNSRSGIPRCAATDLARRKTVSGISNVAFTQACSHIYGSKSTDRSEVTEDRARFAARLPDGAVQSTGEAPGGDGCQR